MAIHHPPAQEELGDAVEAANTLHELGVLCRTNKQLDRAQAMLERALAAKRKLGAAMGTGSQSASMYQLAVVLTCMRPPQLEKAEAMFRLVLDGTLVLSGRQACMS